GLLPLLLGHEILARHAALEQERREWALPPRVAGVGPGGRLRGILAQQARDRVRRARRRAAHPRGAQRHVHRRDHVAEHVAHVGVAELEERRPLHDALGAVYVLLTRQLHDQAAAPDDLYDGLGGAELVHARAYHSFG